MCFWLTSATADLERGELIQNAQITHSFLSLLAAASTSRQLLTTLQAHLSSTVSLAPVAPSHSRRSTPKLCDSEAFLGFVAS